MSDVTGQLLGNLSVVYKECAVECEELPHGVIDIIGGRVVDMDETSNVDVTVGICIEPQYNTILCDPTGISSKTRNTLLTTSLSKYICHICCKFELLYFTGPQAAMESLAFSEIVQKKNSTGKKPIIFLTGMVPLFCLNQGLT